MKKIKLWGLLFLAGILAISCASPRSVERGAQGAALGAGIGYLAGQGKGAVPGALIGGALGSIFGTWETDKGKAIGGYGAGFYGPTPLPWIQGERVSVEVSGSCADTLRAVIEDELRNRGAIIVAVPGRRWFRHEDVAATYVAEVDSYQRGNCAVVQIRIIDRTAHIVRAIGIGQSQFYNSYYYGYGYNYKSFEWAARRAVEDLH